MKFLMDQSVVELRARKISDEWFTKGETMDVMNWLGVIFEKAAMQYDREGNHLLAHIARQDAQHIFGKLEDNNYYSTPHYAGAMGEKSQK